MNDVIIYCKTDLGRLVLKKQQDRTELVMRWLCPGLELNRCFLTGPRVFIQMREIDWVTFSFTYKWEALSDRPLVRVSWRLELSPTRLQFTEQTVIHVRNNKWSCYCGEKSHGDDGNFHFKITIWWTGYRAKKTDPMGARNRHELLTFGFKEHLRIKPLFITFLKLVFFIYSITHDEFPIMT